MDEYIECRLFGHAWDKIPTNRKSLPGEARITLRCTRCTTLRHDVVSAFAGVLLSRSYDKPHNYRRAKTSFADLRKEFVTPTRKRGGSEKKARAKKSG